MGEGKQQRFPLLFLTPLLLYAYPAVAGLLARSEVPQILGRYTTTFFAFNVWSVGVVALLLGAWLRRSHTVLQIACLLLIFTTVLAPANNQMRYLPGINVLMPLVRLVGGFMIVLVGFDRFRSKTGRPVGWLTGLGALFIALSLVDFVLFAVIALAPAHRKPDAGLREAYALEHIGARDLILVGDSFVWGQGVDQAERFGDRLEAILTEHGRSARVYSLGLIGIAAPQYIELLAELPDAAKAERIIVAFYMNDMPPIENLMWRTRAAAVSLGRGFPSLRLAGDKLSHVLAGDVHDYHRYIVESYHEDRPSYAARKALLETQLRRIHELAREHSTLKPVLLILPVMVGFEEYPLENGHRLLSDLGATLDYEVIDLLPVFRETLVDADAHRTSPDDNHFDAYTHDLVARTLYKELIEPDKAESGTDVLDEEAQLGLKAD